jgi:hypothetical protein
MEFEMKNLLRRQVLTLTLGVTATAILLPALPPAYAEDVNSGLEDSDRNGGDSFDDGPDNDSNDNQGGDDDGPGQGSEKESPSDAGGSGSAGVGNRDCAIPSVNCSKLARKK